jgi:hypothetical protein
VTLSASAGVFAVVGRSESEHEQRQTDPGERADECTSHEEESEERESDRARLPRLRVLSEVTALFGAPCLSIGASPIRAEVDPLDKSAR